MSIFVYSFSLHRELAIDVNSLENLESLSNNQEVGFLLLFRLF